MDNPIAPPEDLSDIKQILNSTELPTLETLQKIIWASPDLICAAEKKYGIAKEQATKNGKMLKPVFAVIFNQLKNMPAERAKNLTYNSEHYKAHITRLSQSIGGEIHAQAELNAARNRFRAAEILISVEQTVMRLTSH